MRKIFLYMCVAIAAMACTKNDIVDPNEPPTAPAVIYASIDEQTRTELIWEDGVPKTYWSSNDAISVFNRTTQNLEYQYEGGEATRDANFTLKTNGYQNSTAISKVVAYYPYASQNSVTESDGVITINTNLPETQSFNRSNNYGLNTNAMIAITDNDPTNLSFSNVLGYIKITLKGIEKVTSVALSGRNEEVLAGDVTINPESLEVNCTSDIIKTLTIDCGEGVTLNDEDGVSFIFALPPITFENGFTITATDNSGKKFQKSTQKNVTISRNTIQPMSAINVSGAFKEWSTISYTSDNEIINQQNIYEGNPEDGGVQLTQVGGTYDNKTGEGTMIFNGTATHIYHNAFTNNTNLKGITIPANVVSIGNQAFMGCHNLKTITMPTGNYAIGILAFASCNSLQTIDISNATDIGASAFSECKSLTEVTMPTNNYIINNHTFAECTSLETIDTSNATSVGDTAFVGCTSLESINLASVTNIGTSAFVGCIKLANVTLPAKTAFVIGDNAFSGCTSLVSLDATNATSIGNTAFTGCEKLEHIKLLNVETIGAEAFTECQALVCVELPTKTTYSIGEAAFINCTSLKDIYLGYAVNIGISAFETCTSLTEVILFESTKETTIENGAFFNCENLKSVTFKDVNANLLTVGEDVFTGCNNLTAIYVPSKSLNAYQDLIGLKDYKRIITAK